MNIKTSPLFSLKMIWIAVLHEIDGKINDIRKNICEKFGREIPVIFLYASPEIETWFLCDWDNSFVSVYHNKFFCHHLKKCLEELIMDKYCDIGIENFGLKEEGYVKLSDLIVNVVAVGVKEKLANTFANECLHIKTPQYVQDIIDNRDLYYSKKIHGDMMLRRIIPDNIIEQCNIYFKPAVIELRKQ